MKISDDQRASWQKIIKKHPEANFLQTEVWAEANRLMGFSPLIEITDHGLFVAFDKHAKRGHYLEIPGGPILDWSDKKAVDAIFTTIKKVADEHNCAFVRIRPQIKDSKENRQMLAKLGAKVAPMHLAAEHTVMIDLSPSEDELLANMRRQTRYEVRRASKLEIKVEKSNDKAIFTEFHKVQVETAARQHFIPPTLDVLMAEREAFQDDTMIYKATTKEGEPIAYGLILTGNGEGDYFEAASTDLNRKLPGAYALQWQVIRDLKKQGIKRYNLWGIAPKNQPNHRYAGVTTFKTGFGGEVTEFIPAHDIVIDPIRYKFNLAVETVRKKRRHL